MDKVETKDIGPAPEAFDLLGRQLGTDCVVAFAYHSEETGTILLRGKVMGIPEDNLVEIRAIGGLKTHTVQGGACVIMKKKSD